ncbi:MAG TPA: ATP-binding protein, partial [Holophagaceae bacterium]
ILGHLVHHVATGPCTRLVVRTWGGTSHFRLEMEDDGGPLAPEWLAGAFEPFSGLRPPPEGSGRKPGSGLPTCAQLIAAYRGTLEIENAGEGTRVRLSMPLE